jgi:hypothetical protein
MTTHEQTQRFIQEHANKLAVIFYSPVLLPGLPPPTATEVCCGPFFRLEFKNAGALLELVAVQEVRDSADGVLKLNKGTLATFGPFGWKLTVTDAANDGVEWTAMRIQSPHDQVLPRQLLDSLHAELAL